jgi:coenzyme F420-dependent glucose-6-phosphate dehydrogenase
MIETTDSRNGRDEQDMLKIGYKASAEQFSATQLLDFSVLAEEVGFDSVFISDHFQPWKHTDGHAPASIAWLGALGARTKRIAVGTSVLTPTFRYHPSVVAQAFGTLGQLFPGRVILGVGTGEALNEVPATGMAWPEAKERFARLRESVALIRKLWTAECVSFEGQYYKTENATIYDRPQKPIPIYVAGAGPMIAKFAGRSADGFICTSGKAWDLYKETLLPNVEAGLADRKSPAQSYGLMIEMKISYDTNKDRALQDTKHWAALALTPEEKMTVKNPLEMEKLAAAVSVERASRRWIVSADPDEQVEQIRPYIEMGFRHLVFHAPGPDQQHFLRLYAKDVLPRLRKAFG